MGEADALAVSPSGVLYVVDDARHQIFARLGDGTFQVVAGNGTDGFSGDGGPATAAQLSSVSDIAFSLDGELYIADGGRIRVVDRSGIIRTVVGNGGTPAAVVGQTPALSASLGPPVSIAFSPAGSLYLTTSAQTSQGSSGPNGSLTVTGQSQLLRLDPEGVLQPISATVTSGLAPPQQKLDEFDSIAVGSGGTIFAASLATGWSVYEIHPDGDATYLGQARRSGGNTTIVQAGPGGLVVVDDGPNLLRVEGDNLVPYYSFAGATGVRDFVFVSYFAIAPDGVLYADDLDGAFGPFQQIVQVVDGRASSIWRGPQSPE